MVRFVTRSLLPIVAFLLLSLPLSAGGWATVEFDSVPDSISAEQPVPLRFLLRQHGETPVHQAFGQKIEATVNVYANSSGETTTFTAQQDTDVGYYRANVTFPREGSYDVTVTTNVLDTSEVMPTRLTVSVSAPAPIIASTVPAGQPSPVLPLLSSALLLVVVCIIALVRTRNGQNTTAKARLS